MYGAVEYLSQGCDDELFNIILIEKLGSGFIAFTQADDVDPPG